MGIRVGHPAVYADSAIPFGKNQIVGRALDNRIGGFIISALGGSRFQIGSSSPVTTWRSLSVKVGISTSSRSHAWAKAALSARSQCVWSGTARDIAVRSIGLFDIQAVSNGDRRRVRGGAGLLCGCGKRVSTPWCPWCGARIDDAGRQLALYLEKNAENLSRKLGEDAFFVLHSALSRGGKLGERHETGVKELVPGILERSVVITRSILKHIGVSPTTWGGTRGQPFAPGAGVEAVTGLLAGQAGRRAMPDLEERREFIQ